LRFMKFSLILINTEAPNSARRKETFGEKSEQC